MPSGIGIWLRREAASNERRTPLVPTDAARLIAKGMPVTVEESESRAFPIDEYSAAGCHIVPGDTWPDAPPSEIILGLKEPPGQPSPLTHRHVLFGHAYKGQEGGPGLLRRFIAGGGTLLDLEYLTDEAGRRVVAFGFWAGYVGAALAALHHRGELDAPLRSMTRPEFDEKLRGPSGGTGGTKALVIGALGRSGRGACEALAVAGVPTTEWDIDETRDLDRSSLLDHDILVNTVFATEPGTPFLTAADLGRGDRRLTVVSDVTCDVTSACNRLPINDKVTDWARPVRRLHYGPPPLDMLAIDNLPSLLPRESSTAFSAGLLPHLTSLPHGAPIWDRCLERFHDARRLLAGGE
jgi:saccharopine dehydrogenase (NAD+, L-lysine forming)